MSTPRHTMKNITSAGPVDGKRRKELKDLFAGCKAGLVFVTAFENNPANSHMQTGDALNA